MCSFFLKTAYYVVVLLNRTVFRRALEQHDIEERKKAMAILEAVELPPEDIEKIQEMLAQKSGVDLEIVVDQFVSIATRMLSEDVDDEYIRLCYNWEE